MMLVKERSSYPFNDLCATESEIRVIKVALELGDHLCKSKVGLLQRELNGEKILLNSYRTRFMSMAKMDIKVRT